MPTPFPSNECSIPLTGGEYNRLQTLNSELLKAEQWITQCSKDMVLSYTLATARERHANDGRLDEDVELTAILIFLARNCRAGAPTLDDRVITQISIPILSKLHFDGNASTINLRTNVDDTHQSPWHQLLLELYERALLRDKAKLLSIGSICIDVILIQQRLTSW